jgi:hypothetical protein
MICIRPQSAILQSHPAFLYRAKRQINSIYDNFNNTYYNQYSLVSFFYLGLEFMMIQIKFTLH